MSRASRGAMRRRANGTRACPRLTATLPIVSPPCATRLQQAGYSFKRADGLTADAIVLSVTTENLVALGEAVKAANTEAARTGAPK